MITLFKNMGGNFTPTPNTPFEARWSTDSSLRLYLFCCFHSPQYLLLPDPRPSTGWESLSKVALCDAGGGVTKTGPIIGNFLTFWWFWLLTTAGYRLSGKHFSILKILFHIQTVTNTSDEYCFPEKASMLRRLTKINHFLLCLVVAWSRSSQIWSLFEHDESWCSGPVSIIRTLRRKYCEHSQHTTSSCIFQFENDSLTPMPL